MGCKTSKDERSDNPGSSSSTKPEFVKQSPEEQCRHLATLACTAYWEHLSKDGPGKCPAEILLPTWESFMSTLVDTCSVHLRLHFDTSKAQVKLGAADVEKLPSSLRDAALNIVPRQVDICVSRLMDAWINSMWPNVGDTVTYELAFEISRELAFSIDHCDSKKSHVRLSELFDGLFWNIRSTELTDLFKSISNGKPVLSVDDMAAFYNGQGVPEFQESQAEEKIKLRFGGSLTYRSFAAYFGNALLNSALDLQRSTVVWQDMTKPLPNYLVMTCTVETERDIVAALLHGARALILNVYKEGPDVFLSPGYTARAALKLINDKAFNHNPFPIVLSFNPECDFPVDCQTDVADLLVETFKDRLPKGLMFEGATVTDPLFSPAALKEKVLIMAKQAPLKPFVGLFVADMHREGLGVRVTDVKEATPAAKAGIHKDDWLTHINDRAIGDKKNLKVQLSQLKLGDVCTVRKENLDEVKLVVGGAINGGAAAAQCSEKLSDVVFIRIEKEHVAAATTAPPSAEQSLESTQNSTSTATTIAVASTSDTKPPPLHTQPRPVGSPSSPHAAAPLYAPWETETVTSASSVQNANDHFLRTPSKKASKLGVARRPSAQNGTISAPVDNRQTMHIDEPGECEISRYDAASVHFVDVRISRAAWLWANGKFADNGHCGYLLAEPHSTPSSPTAPPTTISITLSCSPVACKGMPLALFQGHVLGGDLVKSSSDAGGHQKVDIVVQHRRSVVILEFQYEAHDSRPARTFVAAMPAHLMRPGYHAVTLIDAERNVDSIDDDRSSVAVCFVQRQ